MRHVVKCFLLAFTSLASAASGAWGDEIVVTATRAPTAASRLPARIEVIGRDDIEALGLATLPEALGSQAVQAGGAGQQASLFLRGGNSKHALMLFDGVRLNDASTPNAQYDFGLDLLGAAERVEVLRGPASAIYGSDALGGVVNFIPRTGGADLFEPFVEASAGSFDTHRALVGAAGAGRAVSYGASAEWYDSAGYDLIPGRIATHTGHRDPASISTLTASARHDGGAYAIDGLLRWRRSETDFDTFSGGTFFDLRADDPDLRNEATQTLWRVGAELEAGGTLNFRIAGGQVLSDRSEQDDGAETSSANSERSFADLLAFYRNGGTALTLGVSLERNSIDTRPQFASPLRVAEDQAAIFLIGQADAGDRVVVTASVRIDDYASFGTQTTYALGAVADLAPLRLFASYGTAFKAPSLSERFEISFFNVGNADLRPEESSSWELGADWSADERLSFGASYYQTRIDDLIEYNFAALQNLNVGKAAIDGAEVFAAFAPVAQAELRLSYAWTDARNDTTSARLTRRAEHAWRLDARYRPSNRVGLALNWSYVGERTDVTYDDSGGFASGAGAGDGFHLVDLAATYALGDGAELFARVSNLTDEVYEQPAAFAGAPRNGAIGVRARF